LSQILNATQPFNLVPLPLEKAVLGTAAGWLLFTLPGWTLALARTNEHPAVGAGDVSLIGACGAWLGPQSVIVAGCMAVIAALVIRCVLGTQGFKRQSAKVSHDQKTIILNSYLPFEPLISMASIAVLCADPYHYFFT
jgi:prepilin signal peptidase PulO-like enzyme (type II secretory pathway)